jgi:2-octaprenyl-6-methoxyphenol hydroxylase
MTRSSATHQVFDVLIIGGGPVGASLACALGQRPLRVGVVESSGWSAVGRPGYDDRSLALSFGTRRIFEAMGLWPGMADRVTPIVEILVSDRGHFGTNRLNAEEYGFDALGYVVENRTLGQLFAERLPVLPNVELIHPAQLVSLRQGAGLIHAELQQAGDRRFIDARLLVGADGGQSSVRRLSAIGARSFDYGQTAVIANLSPELPHRRRAYERFTENGPLALLPLSENRCALVWTVDSGRSVELMALCDADFIAALQPYVGDRLGRIMRVGARTSYPLALVTAKRHTAGRTALIGNAMHTLHPVAGQGFNLGLRDVAALAEVVSDAAREGKDPGSAEVLARYEDWRRRDQQRVITLTDGLIRLFSNDFGPLVVARNLGMIAIDLIPPLKRALLRQTMGLAGRLPRLARGLAL